MKALAITILLVTIFFSCKKSTENKATCFSDITTVRTINSKPTAIQLLNNQYYIVEQLTIDTKLLPCNLADEFKVNNLLVTVTGGVKNTIQNGTCCTENFVITKSQNKILYTFISFLGKKY
jgi:hypothetical protein